MPLLVPRLRRFSGLLVDRERVRQIPCEEHQAVYTDGLLINACVLNGRRDGFFHGFTSQVARRFAVIVEYADV